MSISQKDIEEIVGLLAEAESFKPIADLGVKVLDMYTPYLGDVCEKFRSFMVQSRIRSIKEYEGAGFTTEDAILMTVSDSVSLQHLLNQTGQNRKK